MSFIKLSSESALLIEFRVNPCVKYSFVHRRVGGWWRRHPRRYSNVAASSYNLYCLGLSIRAELKSETRRATIGGSNGVKKLVRRGLGSPDYEQVRDSSGRVVGN
jgi:hypothetical protein